MGESRDRDLDDGAFLETVSHELREPLTALVLTAEAIRRGAGDDEGLQRAVAVLDRELGRITRVADDLLDLSRLAEDRVQLRFEHLDLDQALGRAIRSVEPELRRRALHLRVRLPPAPVPMWGDQARMVQLLTVLLDDLTRDSPPGTTISLSLASDSREIALRIAGVDGWVRRRGGGGLMLVRRLLHLHGGVLALTAGSASGGGEMVVRLPMQAGSPEGTRPVKAPESTPPVRSQRILVVDDHRDTADALARVLELRGHRVLPLYGGRTALEALETFRPDVVVMDLGLPVMDGLEVARQVRARPGLRDLILVAATGQGGPDERRRSFLAGFDHHLVKPVMPEQIEAVLACHEPASLKSEPAPPRPG